MKIRNNRWLMSALLAGTLLFGTTGCYSVDEPTSDEVTMVSADATKVEETEAVVDLVVSEEAEVVADTEVAETTEGSVDVPELDFAGAAEALGLSEAELTAAFGDANDGPPDLAAIAETFGTTEEALSDLLGLDLDAMGSMNTSTIVDPYDVEINGITFEVTQPMYHWDGIPDNISVEREAIQSFTNEAGETHYYEVVYVSTCNLDWYQYAYLAEQAGGYLACLETEEENAFVFSLVNDDQYFWAFPDDGDHYGIKIGPVLGGYQPAGSIEPAGGWTWLSGTSFEDSFVNWAVNLDDGTIDKDPRDNTQPNDSADGQPIMGFGELNVPVETWGDYTASQTNPEGIVRGSYACIIEYEEDPAQ